MSVVEKTGVELIVEGLRTFMSQMQQADKSVDGLGATASKSSSILEGAFATALGVGIVKAAEAAITAIAGIGKAFIGFTAESFTMAADFQTSLTGLQIAASGTGLSFDALHDAAITVGGDMSLLGVSASGAAEAMTGLFKAGLSNVEVFGDLDGYMAGTAQLGGALRASIDLAAATEMDMVQASELAAVALATFGGGLETAEERSEFVNTAMNNMVQTADASVASVSELADAMVNVGPTAAALGMPIEDMNNSLAILSMRGIRGAEAGTALKSMLVNLQRPTPAVTQALDKLNVSLYDASGNFVGMESLVGQLETAYANLTPEQRNLNSQIIAGSYGMNALNSLLGAGAEGWDEMALATANAATIQEQAAAYAETYAGKQEAMNGQIETLRIQVGEALMPVMTTLLGTFSKFIENHGPQLVKVFENIVTGITPVIDFIGKAMEAFETFSWATSVGVAPLDALKLALQTTFGPEVATFVMNIVTQVQTFIENIKTAAESPFVTQLVATLSGAFNTILEVVATVVPLVIEWLTTMQPTFEKWGAFIMQVISQVAGFILPLFQEMVAFLAEKIGFIVAFVQENMPLFQAYFEVALTAIQGIWDTVWSAIVMIVSSVWEVIKTIVNVAIEIMTGIIKTVMQAVTGDWEGAWETVKTTAAAVWEAIKTGVADFINNVLEKMGTTMSEVKATWQGNWDSLVAIVKTIWDNIKTAVSTAIADVKAFFTDTDWGAVGKSIIDGIASGITAAASAIANAAKAAAQAALDAAKKLLGIDSPSKVFKNEIGKNIDYGIAAGVADFTPVITKQMGNLTNALLPALGGMTQMLSGLAPASAAGRTTNYNSNSNASSITNNMIHLTPALALESVGMTIAA